MAKHYKPLQFGRSQTPNEAAWYLAVALVHKANLAKPSYSCSLLSEVFDIPSGLGPRFIQELVCAMADFSFITSGDDLGPGHDMDDFDAMRLFCTTRCRFFDVEVTFHRNALPFLQKLKLGIHELYELGALSETNLKGYMKAILPNTLINMGPDMLY